MKKQKIAFLLSLTWLIGMLAFFSFPLDAKNSLRSKSQQSELKSVSAPNLIFNVSDHSPEVPAFKIGLSLIDFLSANWSIDLIPSFSQYLSPSFFTKSKALFDNFITFFYFYYTW